LGVATPLAATLMRITILIRSRLPAHARALYHSTPMRYLLALDQGTTSSRALLFDERAALLGMAQEEHPQIYPEPGWVEHDPELLWQTQVGTARRVLAEHGVCGREIAAIEISNQRETTLLWDRESGRPLANAIVWQDRRTAPHCERLREEGLEPMVRDKTGLLLDPYFSATKLAWLLAHLPGARRHAERGELCFGTVDSYLLFRLTGGAVHATDVSNASRTLLFNIHRVQIPFFIAHFHSVTQPPHKALRAPV
jgi:glycerol kinase